MHSSKTLRPRSSRAVILARVALAGLVPLGGLCASSARSQDGTIPENHAIAEGDTLWDLSERYYGSSYEWPRLWSYNPEITNPHWIYPGFVLRLRDGAEGGMAGPPGVPSGDKPLQGKLGLSLRRGRPRGEASGTVTLGEEAYLDEDALKRAARIVGAPEDHMMFSLADEVYLQLPKGQAVREGQELTVFRHLKRAELSPNSGKMRTYKMGAGGEVVRVLGSLRVKRFDPDKRMALAEVTEALDPIERGFEVADVPRTLARVPPKVNERKVVAEIVAATEALGTLGQNQVVFINAGQNQGVQIGNRFSVLRQGDPWRQTLYLDEELSGEERPNPSPPAKDAYPREVVGEARAIYVRPESTTALITDSVVELNPGDRVELREGY